MKKKRRNCDRVEPKPRQKGGEDKLYNVESQKSFSGPGDLLLFFFVGIQLIFLPVNDLFLYVFVYCAS